MTNPGRPYAGTNKVEGRVKNTTLDRLDAYATAHGISVHKAVGEILDRAVEIINLDAIR